jgi:hypothetical protein
MRRIWLTEEQIIGVLLPAPGSWKKAMSWAIGEKGYSQRCVCALIGRGAQKMFRCSPPRGDDAGIRTRLRSLRLATSAAIATFNSASGKKR